MMFPKEKPARSAKYRDWIRKQPCCICRYIPQESYGYLIHAHHTQTGGMGTKGSDLSLVPLCFACHDKVHALYGKKGYWSNDQLSDIIARLNEKWLAEGNEKFW